MSVRTMARAIALGAVFLLVVGLVGPFSVHADLGTSVTYLQAHPSNPWVTMALVAAGTTPDTNYLKTLSRTSATDYEASILALTAAGADPRTYASEDLIAKLEGFETQNQLGDATLLNDDIFGVLALVSAGVPASDTHVSNTLQFIKSHQLANGGWGYATNAASDTNTTAAAVMALRAAGVSASDSIVTKAITYLKGTKNSDGGYPYDPSQSYSSGSDSSSDAWVISALLSIGEQPSTTHLQSLIDPSGFVHYQSLDDTANSFTPVSTAYAVIALSGKYYPVGSVAGTPQQQGVSVKYLFAGSTGTLCTGTIKAVTALDVVKNASVPCGFTYHIKDTSFGAYVDQIGSDTAAGSSGWLYAVNGKEPSVGAGDYTLKDADGVIWFFGPFDAPVPTMPAATGVDLSATIVPTDTVPKPTDSAGFEIDITKLAFGSLKPGSVGTAQFTVRNTGTQPVQLLTSVTGDDVFRNYLQLAGTLWRQFSLTLAQDQTSSVQARLPIPATYTATGAKSGTLTFWATAAN